MIRRPHFIAVLFFCLVAICYFPSCKSCNKTEPIATTIDTTSPTATTSTVPLVNTANIPHGDSALIPVLAQVLDDAFAASAKKDYAKVGSLIIYRGTDPKRFGKDVYNTAKNSKEKNIVRITSDVFNKWNNGVESKDYTRIFELDQPGGNKMIVLEVLFVSPKSVDRLFFAFLQINDSYKIADVSSYL